MFYTFTISYLGNTKKDQARKPSLFHVLVYAVYSNGLRTTSMMDPSRYSMIATTSLGS